MLAAASRSADRPSAAVDHLVAGRAQGDPQGPGQLGVVVDDEHPAHGAGSAAAAGAGTAAAAQRDDHRQPTAGGVLGGQRCRPSPRSGRGRPRARARRPGRPGSRRAAGTARRPAPGRRAARRGRGRRPAARPGRRAAPAVTVTGPVGRVADGVADEVGDHPLEQAGVGERGRQVVRPVQLDAGAVGLVQPGERAGARRRAGRSGLSAGLTAPACRRLMSSRLSTSSVSRSADSSMVADQLGAVGVGRGPGRRSAAPRTAALIPASGVRRSWLTAASRAVRMLLPAASRSASAAWAASRPCCSATAACSAKATSTRRSLAGRVRPDSRRARVSVTATSSVSSRRARRRPQVPTTRSPSAVRSTIVTAPQPEGLADLLEQAGQPAVARRARTGTARRASRSRPGAGGGGGPPGGAVDDRGHGDGHDQPAEQRRRRRRPGSRSAGRWGRRRTSSRPARRAPRPPAPATARRPGRRRGPAAGRPAARRTARPPRRRPGRRRSAPARRPGRAASPSQRRRAVSAPVSGGSRQPREPAAAWVTMCTSISPESAMTWPPMPAADRPRPARAAAGARSPAGWRRRCGRTPAGRRRRRRRRPGGSCRRGSPPAPAACAARAGEAPVRPSEARTCTASRAPLPERCATREARRISVSPSGPPVSATTTRSRASQTWSMWCSALYRRSPSSTRSASHSSASSRSAVRLPTPEVVAQRGVDPLGRVDVAVRQPAAQRLGGHVDQLDLVGAADHGVGHRLLLGDAGDLLDDVVEALQVLDVDRGQHVDAGGEDLVDVLPALLVPRAGRVGVRQLVDDDDLGMPGEHRVDVELGQRHAAVGDLPARQDLQALQLLSGAPPAVGLDQPDDDVGAAGAPPVRLAEHGEGLPDAGGGAQVDAQGPTGHAVHDRPVGGRSAPVEGVRIASGSRSRRRRGTAPGSAEAPRRIGTQSLIAARPGAVGTTVRVSGSLHPSGTPSGRPPGRQGTVKDPLRGRNGPSVAAAWTDDDGSSAGPIGGARRGRRGVRGADAGGLRAAGAGGARGGAAVSVLGRGGPGGRRRAWSSTCWRPCSSRSGSDERRRGRVAAVRRAGGRAGRRAQAAGRLHGAGVHDDEALAGGEARLPRGRRGRRQRAALADLPAQRAGVLRRRRAAALRSCSGCSAGCRWTTACPRSSRARRGTPRSAS